MPFTEQEPLPFTQAGIEQLIEDQHGVYGIFRGGTWIYVGMGDIRRRLFDHFGGDNPCILRENPTDYVSELTANASDREKELIAELDPICNRRVG